MDIVRQWVKHPLPPFGSIFVSSPRPFVVHKYGVTGFERPPLAPIPPFICFYIDRGLQGLNVPFWLWFPPPPLLICLYIDWGLKGLNVPLWLWTPPPPRGRLFRGMAWHHNLHPIVKYLLWKKSCIHHWVDLKCKYFWGIFPCNVCGRLVVIVVMIWCRFWVLQYCCSCYFTRCNVFS